MYADDLAWLQHLFDFNVAVVTLVHLSCHELLLYYTCRSASLQNMRGKLLSSTFSAAHYSQLKDIGLSQQEKEAEIATIQHAIDHAGTQANNIKPGHTQEIVVGLARDTFATVTVLKPKKNLD